MNFFLFLQKTTFAKSLDQINVFIYILFMKDKNRKLYRL